MDYETVQTSSLSALKIGEGTTRVLTISSYNDLHKLHELYVSNERIHILGEGTNSVFGSYTGIAVRLGLLGYEWLDDSTLKISAGEQWQKAVDLSVSKNLHGIECLTLIPGTVGAAPVQNIGAFGQLLSNRLASIEVYDYVSDSILNLTTDQCGFGAHRDSYFKSNPTWFSYVIVSVSINLLDASQFTPPTHPDIIEKSEQLGIQLDTIQNTEEVIRKHRELTYPDYRVVPTTGSYFTNYELPLSDVVSLPDSMLELNHMTLPGDRVRFQCKHLLSSVGITNGHEFTGGLCMRDSHNNFLINPNHTATLDDLKKCHNEVNGRLEKAYGIKLVPEADFVDDTRGWQDF